MMSLTTIPKGSTPDIGTGGSNEAAYTQYDIV